MKVFILDILARLFCRPQITRIIKELNTLESWKRDSNSSDYYDYFSKTGKYYIKRSKYYDSMIRLCIGDDNCVILSQTEKFLFKTKFVVKLAQMEKLRQTKLMADQMAAL